MNGRVAEILRFGVVGTAGFLADAGVLSLLLYWSMPPSWARLISFPIALSVTWLANRHWTFSEGRSRRPVQQYIRYATIQIAGASLNLAIYFSLIAMGGLFKTYPVLALAAGSVSAMFVNYYLSRRLAFARP